VEVQASLMKIRRLGYALGAEITGIDLTKPLDDTTVTEIRQAWLVTSYCVFRIRILGLKSR